MVIAARRQRFSSILVLVLALALASTTAACGSGGDEVIEVQPSPQTLFGASAKQIKFEVDYAVGAAPYTTKVDRVGDSWLIFKANVNRLFEATGKTIEIPTNLTEMQKLTDVSGTEFTTDQILDIASKHRDHKSTASNATFYLLWLPGYYADKSMVRKDVLGVSLGSTGVIAMFKPVIESSTRATGLLGAGGAYVEQSTLTHEFGHAIGLVNRGIALKSAHHDAEHGAHCTDPNCVMYYAIESPTAIIDIVKKLVAARSVVLFANDCLADVDAAAGR
jgi:hypothetical protein